MSNNIGVMLKTGSVITICLPLGGGGGHKIVFHASHKQVPEFILIPYDVDENHIY